MRVPQVLLTGGPGDVSLWHPFILHGTQPEKNSAPRISMRFLVAAEGAAAGAGSELALANARIAGPSSLSRTREDLDEAGAAVLKGNVIDGVPGRS
jgi:ectoine hydroxylase-related dioxygenase (phytanoyl-CoA dioxygenase family)